MSNAIPRPEYPEPQFERKNWRNLNGEWQFEIDAVRSKRDTGIIDRELEGKITVPFCPESKLSGVENKDFMLAVWYRREVEISPEELEGHVLLHFGAVDYEAFVYVNGKLAGTHKGGYVSFAFDITKLLKAGKNIIVVCAEDDTRDPLIPTGKQSEEFYSHACCYTRTTGIWQTVWLEFTPKEYIKSVKYFPDYLNGSVCIAVETSGIGTVRAEITYEGRPVGDVSASTEGAVTLGARLDEIHLWEVGNGRLYDVKLYFGDDEVKSYFGLRNVRLDGYKFLLNGKSVFQRLILDQGFYPDGIYTAPTDGELLADIERSMAMGFNGARLHQKVFEPRFLYHCDRTGYIVWGEYANWGLDHTRKDTLPSILPEWLEEIKRDFNHPAIVGWCPFNETWDQHGCRQWDDLLRLTYIATKDVDKTRPCIDTSGNYHVVTDIFDVHDYEQNPEVFKENYDELMTDGDLHDRFYQRQEYRNGQPTFVSEYGGIAWIVDGKKGWGYGSAPKTEEEFIARYKGLTDALLDNSRMLGLCYTQLTDVEQEQNGLYTYDRRPKFDPKIISAITSRKAAIED